jgi:osmotically-inducible protein OsmY
MRNLHSLLPLTALSLLGMLLAPLLTGSAKADAELPGATKNIPGSDDALEAQLITAYSLNEHLSIMDIEVDAEKGHVTLEGSVPSEAQRKLAGQLAEDLIAARSIDNQIEVRPGQQGGVGHDLYHLVEDANITTRVELQLAWVEATAGADIRARSSNGILTLDGSATSAEQKQAAERIGRRTAGVRAVTNNIEVQADAGAGSATDTNAALSDHAIEDRVKSTLRFVGDLRDGHLQVTTDDGVVTLGGRIRSEQQKQRAVDIVRGLSGVREVQNEISVTQAG